MKIAYPKALLLLTLTLLFAAVLLVSQRLTDKQTTAPSETVAREITEAVWQELTESSTAAATQASTPSESTRAPDSSTSPRTTAPTVPTNETTADALPALSPTVSDTLPLVTGLADTTRLAVTTAAPTPSPLVTGLADTTRLTLPVKKPQQVRGKTQGAYVATVYGLDFPKSADRSARALTEELNALVEKAARNGVNTLYFQVRPASDAFYDSKIFPTSRFLVEREGDSAPIDVLKTLITLAHRRGIQVYAWINPYRVTVAGEALDSLSEENPARLYPDCIFEKDGAYYYRPASEKAREIIVAGVAEIVKSYAVDGILFDDYFYPEGMASEDADDYRAYLEQGGKLSLDDFRRENVNTLVRACCQAIKAIRADCAFGVAPRGIWRNITEDSDGSITAGASAYDGIYCDALAWVREKTIDFLAPQLYWSYHEKAAPFLTLALWWEGALKGSGVALIPSLAAYRLTDEELTAEIFYLSSLPDCHGYALYRIAYLE